MSVTSILSRMILKKRFVAAPGDEHQEDSELEQVRSFKDITDDIAKYSQAIDPGDFMPVLK